MSDKPRRARIKRQLNIELTGGREDLLMHFAEVTESISTNGPNRGEPSIGAMMRRICEGKVSLVYKGKTLKIPLKYFLDIQT